MADERNVEVCVSELEKELEGLGLGDQGVEELSVKVKEDSALRAVVFLRGAHCVLGRGVSCPFRELCLQATGQKVEP